MTEEAAKVPPLTYREEDYQQVEELYRQVNGKEPPADREELLPTTYLPYREDLSLIHI